MGKEEESNPAEAEKGYDDSPRRFVLWMIMQRVCKWVDPESFLIVGVMEVNIKVNRVGIIKVSEGYTKNK